jgi:septum formation protein
MTIANNPLVLASQSVYRRALLERLALKFECISPHIDEKRLDNENIADMVMRLGREKASLVAKQHPHAWIIASDQSADFNNQALGKPGNFNKALDQLMLMQGKRVTFYTSLVLYTPEQRWEHLDETHVYFRQLSKAQLSHYLQREEPYQCAGAFKSEGLGACLFDRIENQDPSAIIGLPMIQLAHWLTDLGRLLR